jgi:hypothetical protein
MSWFLVPNQPFWIFEAHYVGFVLAFSYGRFRLLKIGWDIDRRSKKCSTELEICALSLRGGTGIKYSSVGPARSVLAASPIGKSLLV